MQRIHNLSQAHATTSRDLQGLGVLIVQALDEPYRSMSQRHQAMLAKPHNAWERPEERAHDSSVWDQYLTETRYIGEVGLDAGPRFFKSLDAQKRVFQHILQKCAQTGDKIITVHSVRYSKTVLDLIEAHLPSGRGKIVLHWFTGTKNEAKRALELGCYFSLNAGMLNNQKHIPMVLSIPLERGLAETDGPFTRTGDRPSQPTDIANVVEELARLHGLSMIDMTSLISNNLRILLSG